MCRSFYSLIQLGQNEPISIIFGFYRILNKFDVTDFELAYHTGKKVTALPCEMQNYLPDW